MLHRSFEETGWHPTRVKPVAGALLYTKYGLLLRFVMKLIAKRAGGATDTSRDHKYTDWVALDRFVDELAEESGRVAPGRRLPGAPTDPDVQISRIRLFETRLRYTIRTAVGFRSG